MNNIYELALWNVGRKTTLGYFKTRKEATDAMREAKKYWFYDSEEFGARIVDGIAGFEVVKHKFGFNELVERVINYNKERQEDEHA